MSGSAIHYANLLSALYFSSQYVIISSLITFKDIECKLNLALVSEWRPIQSDPT